MILHQLIQIVRTTRISLSLLHLLVLWLLIVIHSNVVILRKLPIIYQLHDIYVILIILLRLVILLRLRILPHLWLRHIIFRKFKSLFPCRLLRGLNMALPSLILGGVRLVHKLEVICILPGYLFFAFSRLPLLTADIGS